MAVIRRILNDSEEIDTRYNLSDKIIKKRNGYFLNIKDVKIFFKVFNNKLLLHKRNDWFDLISYKQVIYITKTLAGDKLK
jgi:hypothetical protein